MEKISLRDAFVKREQRFKLLDRGCGLAAFSKNNAILEIGCAGGEAAEHMAAAGFNALTAIDIDPNIVCRAQQRVQGCRFLCADACGMPFDKESFDGIFSEAAFALIPDKKAAVSEYYRILKKGGKVLINDFALREESNSRRQSVQGIPMLMGVQTMEVYRQIFEEQGFTCVYESEEFPELIRIAISLSKTYNISPTEVGQYIVASFGRDEYVNDFFSQTRMSYCQMIFEKV